MARVAGLLWPYRWAQGAIHRLMNIAPSIAPMLGHRQAWQWPQILRDKPQNSPENRGQFVPRMAAERPPMPYFGAFLGRLANIALNPFRVVPVK